MCKIITGYVFSLWGKKECTPCIYLTQYHWIGKLIKIKLIVTIETFHFMVRQINAAYNVGRTSNLQWFNILCSLGSEYQSASKPGTSVGYPAAVAMSLVHAHTALEPFQRYRTIFFTKTLTERSQVHIDCIDFEVAQSRQQCFRWTKKWNGAMQLLQLIGDI